MILGVLFRRLPIALGFIAALAAPAQAQSVEDFYRGKTVSIILGIQPGGGYDLNARLVARHLTNHIPGNPNIVVQYMGGANSVPAANHVYNVSPKDGTVIWAGARLAPYEPLLGNANAKFDVTNLRWLGSTASDHGVVIAWHTAPHQTAADLFQRELLTGATQVTGDTYLYPNALNKLLGTKFKMVSGYPSQAPIALAMERGEVEGSGNWSWSSLEVSYQHWLKEKKIRVLMQLGLDRHPDLPDVPLVMDYAKTQEQRDILAILMGMKKFGYPFFIPPGVPKDRADALDLAFQKMLKDPAYLAEAKQQNRDKGMATGAEMTEVIARAYALPPEVIQRAREIANPQ